jgi:pimeloyl-ACP methyl ester carboxylesterase
MFATVLIVILLSLLSGAAYQIAAGAQDRRRHPPTGQLVTLRNGRRIHARCTGVGTPSVVLEAGIAASSLSWSLVQPRVAAFTRVCSYDRVGLGWSDPVKPPRSLAAHVETLRELLRALELQPPYVLVGHSYGSFVVREYAHRHPREVAGLVFVDPIYPSEWMEPTPELRRRLRGGVLLSHVGSWLARVGLVRMSLKLLTGGAPGAARRVSRAFGSEAASVLGRLVGEVQKLPPETWPFVQAHWSQSKCFSAMARHLSALPDNAAELADRGDLGDIPVLVVTGGHQPDANRIEQHRLANLSTCGRQIIAEGTGHWIHLDNPALVADAIRELVSRSRDS